MTQSRHSRSLKNCGIKLTIRNDQAVRRIKKLQHVLKKPNPPKDGDGKPRVLASFVTPAHHERPQDRPATKRFLKFIWRNIMVDKIKNRQIIGTICKMGAESTSAIVNAPRPKSNACSNGILKLLCASFKQPVRSFAATYRPPRSNRRQERITTI